MRSGPRSKPVLTLCLAAEFVSLAGCRSPYVEATVHNATGGPVTVLEVDYPSASFGKELLPADADFHYRFKVQGSGATKILWTDAARHDHAVGGPGLSEGQQGKLLITLTPASAAWDTDLHPR